MKKALIIICLSLITIAAGIISVDLESANDNSVSEYELRKPAPNTKIKPKSLVVHKVLEAPNE